jgi:hypothetical protein
LQFQGQKLKSFRETLKAQPELSPEARAIKGLLPQLWDLRLFPFEKHSAAKLSCPNFS